MLQHEQQAWDDGHTRLAGVDEAGRGPLAGPVIAAAIIIEPGFLKRESESSLAGLTDSKKLTAKRRSEYFELLNQSPEIEIGVGQADHAEVDAINIRQATHLAMRRACESLQPLPGHVLVDGLAVDGLPCSSTAIVKGDSQSLLIAAASIIAKVTRDSIMEAYASEFPLYGFDRHKGYGSSAHMAALMEHGPSPIHRHSFRPVREAALLRDYVRDHKED